MELVSGVDWGRMFIPQTPILEILTRGTVTYLVLFATLRVFRREAGTVGLGDLLVVVLIADAAQNAMAGDYVSITDGLMLSGTIIGWSVLLDWLGYRFRPIEWLVHPQPTPLVKDGTPLRRNLRREFITMEELLSHMRTQGITDLSEVEAAYLEGDGQISFIGGRHEASGQRKRGRL